MPQSPALSFVARTPANAAASLQLDAQGGLIVSDLSASSTLLNVTAQTVVKTGKGFIARVLVIVAGSAAGTVNDAATTGAVAAANEIATIPNTVGPIVLEFPFQNGLVVTPGTGQTIALSYK